MRIGIICEGGLKGEDQQVLGALAARIVPHAVFDILPQGNKPDLIANCAAVTRSLLDSGCCRVLIVWDVLPRWGKPDGAAIDAQEIRAQLATAGLDTHPCVFLVSIHAELEAWLLADGAALSTVLSQPTHKAKVSDMSKAHSVGDPKKLLQRVFSKHHTEYLPALHAGQIVRALAPNFGVLGKIPSFRKYGAALTQAC